jgi:hypothetical protein
MSEHYMFQLGFVFKCHVPVSLICNKHGFVFSLGPCCESLWYKVHYAPLFLKVALVSLAAAVAGWAVGRGSHSSTSQLNLSAFCGIGVHLVVVYGVFRRCQGVLRSIRGCSGCIMCQKRHRLSREVDECKPLAVGVGTAWVVPQDTGWTTFVGAVVVGTVAGSLVGRCRLTLSNPR